jgi:serine protease Do
MKRTFVNAACIAAFLAVAAFQGLAADSQSARDKKSDKSEKTEKKTDNPPPKFKIDQTSITRQGNNSYAPVIKKAAPSVVSISSSRTVQDMDMRSNPLLNDPLFRRFFGPNGPNGLGPNGNNNNQNNDDDSDEDQPLPQERRRGNRSNRPRSHQETGLGSGVVVTEDGYIITNNHVIEGADDIKVETASGTRYTAKLIGADAPSDIAVLKVEASNLPAITIGNSDQLEVGDVVLAIGNPFAIGQTVTMGIVSGVGRTQLGITDYDDLIQTDAAINMGNSGGALVDSQGRLVGMNTAILSRTGGNVGVGFAVPINMARNSMERLIEYGKVSRGMIGVRPQAVDPGLAKQFKLPEGTTGALVADFSPRGPSPARDAGVKIGDIITEFNGVKVRDDSHLRLMVSQTPPGSDASVKVLRDGKPQTYKFKLAELPTDMFAQNGQDAPDQKGDDNEALEGVVVSDLDQKSRRDFNIPADIKGVLVAEVDPESKSYEAGLRPGNVILEIGHEPVTSAEQAVKMSDTIKGDSVLLRVWSRGSRRFLTVENGRSDKASKLNKPEKSDKPEKSEKSGRSRK